MEAVDFLLAAYPDAPWNLCAITNDGTVESRSFDADSVMDAEAWLECRIGTVNLYFHVNPSRKALNKRASKADIDTAYYVHVDIDPRDGEDFSAERKRLLALCTALPAGVPSPTYAIDSGGGVQLLWRLNTPLELHDHDEIEKYNKRMIEVCGAQPGTWNVDRLLRLPGTVNIPSKKKLSKHPERKEVQTRVVARGPSYDLSHMPQATAQAASTELAVFADVDKTRVDRIDDLGVLLKHNVFPDVLEAIQNGTVPGRTLSGDTSRSGWLFYVVCELLRAGVPDQMIFSIILDPDRKISESVLEKSNSRDYAARQIRNGKKNIAAKGDAAALRELSLIEEVNRNHFVVMHCPTKAEIMTVVRTQVNDVTLESAVVDPRESFELRLANRVVMVGPPDKQKAVPLSKWWIQHPDRRTYQTCEFNPLQEREGVYNLWSGFAYKPAPGDCSLYLKLVREVICSGNEEWYQYLVRWMARAVQRPWEAGQVAVVLQGTKGVGKSEFADHFGSLFGPAYVRPSSGIFDGDFNGQLANAVVCMLDEAFNSKKRGADSKLKTVITDRTLSLNEKYKAVTQVKNTLHVIMGANEADVVAAGEYERRYFIVHVPRVPFDFPAMQAQLSEGGYAALLHYLQTLDLTGFEVRNIPQTDALARQKQHALAPADAWWYSILLRGYALDNAEDWEPFVSVADLAKEFPYRSEAAREVELKLYIEGQGIKEQRRAKIMERIETPEGPRGHWRKRQCYVMPALEDLRAAWDAKYGATQWPSVEFNEVM
jgi:hypothetical protein